MLSKSLIQFFADGPGCVPPPPMRGNGDLLQKDLLQHATVARTVVASPPDPSQATVNPSLHRSLQDTHGRVWLSLVWDHCSYLLGPSVHQVLFVPSKSLFLPVLWKFSNPTGLQSQIPGGILLPPSDSYVRSFPYLLYTLIKLYYTKALSDPASSLAPD